MPSYVAERDMYISGPGRQQVQGCDGFDAPQLECFVELKDDDSSEIICKTKRFWSFVEGESIPRAADAADWSHVLS